MKFDRPCHGGPCTDKGIAKPGFCKCAADAAEIERLRVVLQKIAGVREYDRADYVAANKYKPDEGLWTVDEYLADSALSPA